jgi:hypothetical protein
LREQTLQDPDDHERIEGEAVAVVHRAMFLLCSLPVKPPDAVAQMDRALAERIELGLNGGGIPESARF